MQRTRIGQNADHDSNSSTLKRFHKLCCTGYDVLVQDSVAAQDGLGPDLRLQKFWRMYQYKTLSEIQQQALRVL